MGAVVGGMLGWQEHATIGAAQPARVVPAGTDLRSAPVSVLGGTGVTAYFGLLEPRPPEAR